MNPYPSHEVTSAAIALHLVRQVKPDFPADPDVRRVLNAFIRDPVFEYSAPLSMAHTACFESGGFLPEPDVLEWLKENAAGTWSTYLTQDLRGRIAFELDQDRVLYRINFPDVV